MTSARRLSATREHSCARAAGGRSPPAISTSPCCSRRGRRAATRRCDATRPQRSRRRCTFKLHARSRRDAGRARTCSADSLRATPPRAARRSSTACASGCWSAASSCEARRSSARTSRWRENCQRADQRSRRTGRTTLAGRTIRAGRVDRSRQRGSEYAVLERWPLRASDAPKYLNERPDMDALLCDAVK